jgi:hypothetical protein
VEVSGEGKEEVEVRASFRERRFTVSDVLGAFSTMVRISRQNSLLKFFSLNFLDDEVDVICQCRKYPLFLYITAAKDEFPEWNSLIQIWNVSLQLVRYFQNGLFRQKSEDSTGVMDSKR